MAAVEDDFSAPTNATLERYYQITSGGAPQSINDWSLHAQWRYADGSLALDLTLENGLLVLVDASTGCFKKLVQPADLATAGPAGAITFDILAIPPIGAGTTPKVYRPFQGIITLVTGSTLAAVR